VAVKKADEEPERKYLAVVKMSRKLEIEMAGAFRGNVGPMLQEQGEFSVRGPRKQVFLPFARRAIPWTRRVIHTHNVDGIGDRDEFSPEHAKPCPPRESEGLVKTRVEFVVAGHRELAVSWLHRVQEIGDAVKVVHLSVHEIAGGDKQIGRGLPDMLHDPL
jgi:hypothetical protein